MRKLYQKTKYALSLQQKRAKGTKGMPKCGHDWRILDLTKLAKADKEYNFRIFLDVELVDLDVAIIRRG
jgi:hypothetical protein